MASNDKLKEIHLKIRICYYFGDITNTEDFDIDNSRDNFDFFNK